MTPRRRLILAFVFAFMAFAAASTGHGRQLRAEREAHGYTQWDPQVGWPQPLHEIWQADRTTLKAGSAAAAVVAVVAAVATGGGLAGGAFALVLWGPALGFTIAALASMVRGPTVSPSGAALLVVGLALLAASALQLRRRRQA